MDIVNIVVNLQISMNLYGQDLVVGKLIQFSNVLNFV